MPPSPPSDRIAALEAALQTRWDRETLAVYADCLEAAGDPRGPLIALDLALETTEATPALMEERARLLAAWATGTVCDHPWARYGFRYGLLERFSIYKSGTHTVSDHVEGLIASPIAPYVRALYVAGNATTLAAAIERLASRSWPWLRRLELYRDGGKGPLPPETFAAFAAATPHLEELQLEGKAVLATPGHPNVTTLRLESSAALVVAGAAMPQVRTIDLKLDDHRSPKHAAVLSPRTFPGLRRVDLARNEYTYPATENVSILGFVNAIEAPGRLAELRLPSLRDDSQVAELRAFAARAPNVAIEVARM
ncbi:MAG: hypothetical protein ABI867_26015 [Kofleriaceae bacterium]